MAAELLRAAADLLAQGGAWTKGVFARKEDGCPTSSVSEMATCFCVAGAIERVANTTKLTGHAVAFEAMDRLSKRAGFRHIGDWNDHPDRTHEEVVTAMCAEADKLSHKQKDA